MIAIDDFDNSTNIPENIEKFPRKNPLPNVNLEITTARLLSNGDIDKLLNKFKDLSPDVDILMNDVFEVRYDNQLDTLPHQICAIQCVYQTPTVIRLHKFVKRLVFLVLLKYRPHQLHAFYQLQLDLILVLVPY